MFCLRILDGEENHVLHAYFDEKILLFLHFLEGKENHVYPIV
jgi:hypothetical protein